MESMETQGEGRVLVATFPDASQARRAVADLERAGLDGDAVRLEEDTDRQAVGRPATGAESSSLAPLTGASVGTSAMARGAVKGSIVGGLLGIAAMLPVALLLLEMEVVGRLMIGIVVGAVAGGTVGMLVQGSRQPVQEREDVPRGPGPVRVSVTAPDDDTLERGAEILRGHGAELTGAPR